MGAALFHDVGNGAVGAEAGVGEADHITQQGKAPLLQEIGFAEVA